MIGVLILAAVALVAGVVLASLLHTTTMARWADDERSHR